MSDLGTEPLPAATTDPPPPDPAAGQLEQRVIALEIRVTTLEATDAAAKAAPIIQTPSGPAFDVKAREDELVAQGFSEGDATEQAAYEQRTWNDNHGITNG